MTDMVLSLALPLLVALAVSGVVRLSAGPRRGARLMGVGLGAGFLAWWLWARGVEPFGNLTPLGTAPMLTFVGLVAGALANAMLAERRAAAWGVAAGFGLVGLWLLLDLPSSIAAINGKGMPALVLIALVAVVIHGLGRARERAPSAPALLLTVACVGLAGAATVLEARGVAPAALALAAATLGVLPWLPAGARSARMDRDLGRRRGLCRPFFGASSGEARRGGRVGGAGACVSRRTHGGAVAHGQCMVSGSCPAGVAGFGGGVAGGIGWSSRARRSGNERQLTRLRVAGRRNTLYQMTNWIPFIR